MDAVRLFGNLKLCQCCLQEKISSITPYNKNYGDEKNGSGRVKSTNSSSELSNKECPINLHKRSSNADIDFPAGGRIKSKALQLSAMFRLASDRCRPWPNTRKNFLANFLKQEVPMWRECQWKTQICQLFI